MYVSPSAALLRILTALVAATNELNGAKLKLFVNNVTPTPRTLLAGFTECTAAGYTAFAITWGTPAINDTGFAEVLSQICSTVFSSGSTDHPTIYGYYMTNTAGTVLLYSESFDTPYPITRDGQFLDVIARYVLGQ